VDLVLAVLHVNKRTVVTIEELRVTGATPLVAGLLKDEVIIAIAGE
jgi:hypothetical protein